jgi:hypothetical protein
MKIRIKNGQKTKFVNGELMSEQLISNIRDDMRGFAVKGLDKVYMVERFQISFKSDEEDMITDMDIMNVSNPTESMDQDDFNRLIDGVMPVNLSV